MREPPYDAQEARVAQWIVDRTGVGGGDDPIGFIMASYDYKIHEMDQLRARLAKLEELVAASSRVCGRNNCNCPGAKRVKTLVDEYLTMTGETVAKAGDR